jgi:tyrosine-protein phosphatase SIW14
MYSVEEMLIPHSSLVKRDPFPGHLASFIQHHGIRHCVIGMQGTKKVKIPDAMMHSIMKVVLDQENYPILIHCNHGKVDWTALRLDKC